MMLLYPVEIDLTGSHSLEGAFHAERANVNMTEDQGDEEHGDDGVQDLRDLHPEDVRDVEREQQQISRSGDGDAREESDPEHGLFARIESPRRRMLRFDETAALPEPIDVHFSRDVVLEPHRNDEDEADDERKAREIMHVFGGLREAAERVLADHWQEKNFSKGYVKPRQAENNEGHSGQPVREAFECVEPLNLRSR